MNERTAQKIGEAYAFAQVLSALNEQTPSVMSELLGEYATDIEANATRQVAELDAVAEGADMGDVVRDKAANTASKITEMGETYIGSTEDDPAEMLEWLSFFLGAAVIHWQLIAGSANELGNESFEATAKQGAEYYHELLHVVRTKAEEIGRMRARG